ncbi:MAG: hypothetical protein H5T86_12070 [Armatimonadetes bacterium]|nr:hypothetical protein [Armatimonadota bacterium]
MPEEADREGRDAKLLDPRRVEVRFSELVLAEKSASSAGAGAVWGEPMWVLL